MPEDHPLDRRGHPPSDCIENQARLSIRAKQKIAEPALGVGSLSRIRFQPALEVERLGLSEDHVLAIEQVDRPAERSQA